MLACIMESLRRAHRLTRLLLAWFALSFVAAMAATVLHPQRMELVCSASGPARLVVAGEEPVQAAAHKHAQDCSQCVLAAAPPQAQDFAVHRLPAAAPVSVHPDPIAADRPCPFAARAPPAV
jgi:hypothetical protein